MAAWIGGGAAIVSGGWTALVAITTTRTARRTNQATIDAAAENTKRALDAARDERIWEKRAEAYLDAMRFVRHRRDVYDDITRLFRYDEATEERIKKWLDSFQLPDIRGIEIRLLAYASQPVIDAMNASGAAHEHMTRAHQDWTTAMNQATKGVPGAPTDAQVAEARAAIEPAAKEATAKEEALLDAIRADLHSRPGQGAALPSADSRAMGSQPPP